MMRNKDFVCPPKKVCPQCEKEYPATSEFFYEDSRRRYGLYSWCKKCFLARNRETTKKWRAANKERVKRVTREWKRTRGGSASYRRGLLEERLEKLDLLKDSPCVDCGGCFPPVAMDFDHVCGEKIKSVSYLVRNSTWEAVLEEIVKCELVCANCHRVRTKERGESRNMVFREGVV